MFFVEWGWWERIGIRAGDGEQIGDPERRFSKEWVALFPLLERMAGVGQAG